MEKDEFFELKAIVKGQVQGVGFRASTLHYAKKLNLKGTVRNKSDGSVEMHVVGKKSELDSLLKVLKEEAFLGLVKSIDAEYLPPHKNYSDFRIIH